MKRKIVTIVLLVAFFVGLSVLFYPTIADQYNRRVQSHAIAEYEYVLEEMSEEKRKEILNEAREYNSELAKLSFPFVKYNEIQNYESVLDISGNGLIGHISIPLINVELPIYHGCSESVLGFAVGHLEGSSFPVGGESTHAVISAHRGLATARLFTDLDELSEGDYFTITVLDEALTYQVDKISIVLPDETEQLNIVEGKDYVTLVTCTPYGINSHRLLVRGVRTDNQSEKSVAHVSPQAYLIEPLVVAPFCAIPMLLVFVLNVALKPVKKQNSKEES